MARSRNIKPSFFVNDDLAKISPLGRLLFIGLWTIADREGRLQDKPEKIKVQILPYDKMNVNKLLQDLNDAGFILRYKTENCPCIQILNFHKHQKPHIKEQESELPAPIVHGASMVQSTTLTGTSPADSFNPLIDSLNPIEPEKLPPIPYDKIKNLYNEICTNLPKTRTLSTSRKNAIKARWRQHGNIEVFAEVFKTANASRFMAGDNDRGWSADFSWLLNEENMLKVLEGRYDKKSPVAPAKHEDMTTVCPNCKQRVKPSEIDICKGIVCCKLCKEDKDVNNS